MIEIVVGDADAGRDRQVRSVIGAAFLMMLGLAALAGPIGTPIKAAQTAQPATPASPAATPAAPPILTKADADAWLDGFVPNVLARDDVAGAVVVIIKDGKILTERGFGYTDMAARKPVDPATSLFRVGSISKLFTWTAVMQLVDRGKIDLDADINRYLDFNIPPHQGQPITMRQLMTHTPGFEDFIKGGFRSTGKVPPLDVVVKQGLPSRVFAAGSTPAYSNYGAALAGYIVARVSGMPFDDYAERNIFQPLGMMHASFRQPLPAALAPLMSKSYAAGSAAPKPFELISVPPAGSLTASASDMAKFMIAHLDPASTLVRPESARLLHDPTHVTIPGLNRIGLGFIEQRLNAITAIGHPGDLQWMHSYLWLFPKQNIGIFFAMNSSGSGDSFATRLALFESFGDRYFPVADRAPKELPTWKAHARMLTGHYTMSRGFFTNFVDFSNLIGQTHIGLDEDGRPSVPDIFGRRPRKWIEVAPFQWQDAYGHDRLAAEVKDGKVVRWSIDALSPVAVWLPTPWYRNAAWLMPALILSLGIIAITAIGWPFAAIVRRRYGVSLGLSGGDLTLHLLVHGLSWLALAIFAGWLLVLTSLMSDADLDIWIWLLEIVGAIGFVALMACAAAAAYRCWARPCNWLGRGWSTLRAVAALSILWVAVAFHLISFGANY